MFRGHAARSQHPGRAYHPAAYSTQMYPEVLDHLPTFIKGVYNNKTGFISMLAHGFSTTICRNGEFDMALADDIDDIRVGIKSSMFTNEASVSQGIVLRLLHALQWPQYNTQVVCPEYPSEGSMKVDFALCHQPRKPIAFIEVKKIGQGDGAERQLFEYAFHKGVPLAILTDGREWNFFLPGEQGDYGERRVYKLDIVERDTNECVARFERYLGHEAIASGAAMKAARDDYNNVARERQIKDTLPIAWERLVKEEDELLLEVVADSVENICGFKPDPALWPPF